jgi:uncharacterized membrane protein
MPVWSRVGGPLLGFALLAAAVTVVGALQKAPCANRSYVELREGTTFQCYSDISELLHTEQLLGERLPFIDPCTPQEKPCDEYPVGSMYVMRGTAWLSPDGGDPYARFYWMNASLLMACAVGAALALEKIGGAKTLLFAGAPMLAIYGTMNWDLVPVALTTLATLALLRGRNALTGALLGLGGAVKIYPLLLLVPFALEGRRRTGVEGAQRIAAWAAGTWLAINLPFAIAGTDGWWTFFRFNSQRPAEFDSLWRVACEVVCASTPLVNALSLVGTVVIATWCWRAKTRRDPDTPLWHLAFPLLVAFLLTNKVWSPQYGLWLLPWFALVAPSFRPYLAYQATEVLVYLARFSLFPSSDGSETISYAWLAAAVVLRAAALTWCLAAWIRTPAGEPPAPASARSPSAPGIERS